MRFPKRSIGAGGYLVVFASGKNRSDAAGNVHTDFKLERRGGYVALGGSGWSSAVGIRAIAPAVSRAADQRVVWHRHAGRGGWRPSGRAIVAGGGLTCLGLRPVTGSTRQYSGPIAVQSTTVLRAIGVKQGLLPTNVDTQTYLFARDVLQQNDQQAAARGFPLRWGNIAGDYEMDRALSSVTENRLWCKACWRYPAFR